MHQSGNTPTYPVATSLNDIVAVLEESVAFDMTVDPAAHHDLLDHGLQTAALLRASHPDDVELQVAGLVHDIGHILPPRDSAQHGVVAAAYVSAVLGSRVADLVRLHVPAKRYLVTTEPAYRGQLNEGSAYSLGVQGEAMDPGEVAHFAAEPEREAAIVLRRADEGAKVHGLHVDPLSDWLPALEQLARQ